MRILVYILFALLSLSTASASDRPFYIYRTLSIDNGLSANKITSIAKDSKGTVWVGTVRGLDRLTGNEIIHYNEEEFSGREILYVFVDRKDNLWVSTYEKLFRYSPSTDDFSPANMKGNDISADHWAFSENGIYFSTAHGILEYIYAQDEFQTITDNGDDIQLYDTFDYKLGGKIIMSVHKQGLCSVDPVTGERHSLLEFQDHEVVTSSIVDSFGRLWMSIFNRGLFCIDQKDGSIIFRMDEANSRLGSNIILDMYEDDGQLWIATDGGGVRIMDLSSLQIVSLEDHIGTEIPLQIQSVSAIFKDENGIWCGTVRNGLQCLLKKSIRPLYSGTSLQENFILQCLCEHPDGNIWEGSDGGGIRIFNPDSGTVRSLDRFKNAKIAALAFVDEGRLLISIYNQGIFLYDLRSQEGRRILIESRETDDEIVKSDNIVRFARRYDGNILVITSKIYLFDCRSCQITRVPGLKFTGSRRLIPSYMDKNHTLLYNENELYVYDSFQNIVSTIDIRDISPITCATSNGKDLWVVTKDTIHLYDVSAKKVSSRSFRYKYPIQSVMTDTDGFLWAATADKIFRFSDCPPHDFRIFDSSDGVIKNDYYRPEINMMTSDGDICFGGTSGLCMINTNQIDQPHDVREVSVLSAESDGRNIPVTREKGEGITIQLPYNFGSMELRLFVSGSDVFKPYNFSYVLESPKRSGYFSGNTLTLRNLSSGKHNMSIYVMDASGKWVKTSEDITIDVGVSRMKTFIIIIVVVLIVMFLLLGYQFVYIRNEKSKAEKLSEERQKRLSENKIKFLINVSHELRTPLTLIYAPLKRLLERNDVSDEMKESIRPIYHQSMQMIRIINLIIDARKLEEGYSKLIVSEHDLNCWVKQVTEPFRIEFQVKRIELKYRLDENLGPVKFDDGKCTMALSNFLMNAYKYSMPDSTVTIETENTNGMFRISVIDQGIGIRIEDRDHIFERFERNTSSANGFGLGLAYTKQLIEAHPGGRVGAYPNKDAGATFYFELPTDLGVDGMEIPGSYDEILQNSFQAQDIAKADSPTADVPLKGYKLLLVDDDPELLEFLSSSLKDEFQEIILATDGTQAYEKTISQHPDIIVSDVMMPGLSGYELCRKVKNNLEISHIPVILVTAQADIDSRTEGYKSMADLFITKPFDISSLLDAVRNVIGNRLMVKDRYKTDFTSLTAVSASFSNADEKFLRKLNSYIEENISNDNFDVTMIVDHMCMSRTKFYKKMKELTGIGVKEYVNNIRIGVAANLLITTDLNISEISMKVGISDIQYFSKMFKSHYGCRPTSYREQNR